MKEAGGQTHPQKFWVGENPGKKTNIQAKYDEIWAKNMQTFAKLLYMRSFYKNDSQNENEDVFVGGHIVI